MTTQPITILLAEDSPEDVELTREALKDSKLQINLEVVSNGAEAIDYLYRKGIYGNAKRPDILILDLNMPRKNGLEALAEIKRDDDLKSIPVVILTTSRSEADILKSYKSQANCYICKPLNFEKFIEVVKAIEGFWLTIVRLPIVQREAHGS